jgi:hypothetical protein
MNDYAHMEGYELQPAKSLALNIKAESKKKSLNVKNYKLGAKTMPRVESAVHLGIIRTTSLTENITINVEENIKKASRSEHGLFGGGYHGHNGLDPDTLIHLFKTCTLLGLLFLSAGKVFALSFVFEIVLAVPVVLLSVLLIPYHIIRLA